MVKIPLCFFSQIHMIDISFVFKNILGNSYQFFVPFNVLLKLDYSKSISLRQFGILTLQKMGKKSIARGIKNQQELRNAIVVILTSKKKTALTICFHFIDKTVIYESPSRRNETTAKSQ